MGLIQLAFDFLRGHVGGVAPTQARGHPALAGLPPEPQRLPRPAGPARRASVKPQAVSGKQCKSKVLPAQAGKAQAAPFLIAGELPQHAEANREVMLGQQRIAYLFTRGRRKTIGFSVGPDGLVVRAPVWVPLGQIDSALQEKSAWILRKLGESQDRRGRVDARRMVWADGMPFAFLGDKLTLVLTGSANGGQLTDGARRAAPKKSIASVVRLDDALHIALPIDAPPAVVREAVHAWWLGEAKRHFQHRLDHFAPLLQVRWSRLALTSARTRWGSASSSGAIRLNWRLMHFRPEVIDYVVAHELAHLRHMDHSPRFWAVVASVVPAHLALRTELRKETTPDWH